MSDLQEFVEQGALAAINREVLHPVGLALELNVDPLQPEYGQVRVWDERHDPEGIRFDPQSDEDEEDLRTRLHAFEEARRRRRQARASALGYFTQPLPPPPGFEEIRVYDQRYCYERPDQLISWLEDHSQNRRPPAWWRPEDDLPVHVVVLYDCPAHPGAHLAAGLGCSRCQGRGGTRELIKVSAVGRELKGRDDRWFLDEGAPAYMKRYGVPEENPEERFAVYGPTLARFG